MGEGGDEDNLDEETEEGFDGSNGGLGVADLCLAPRDVEHVSIGVLQ